MFARIKKSGKIQYHQIVENRRVGAKTVQHVISTIGRMDQLHAKGSIETLVRSLSRFSEKVLLILSGKSDMSAKAVERHPDRLTAFAGIDPRKRRRESFLKTLKYEEVYLCYYEMSAEVMTKLLYFIEVVYNQKRLNSALGYLSPNDFED